MVAGLKDCTVLKSTGSEFHGFPRDRYTTLQETTDRILATSVTATWRYTEHGDRLRRDVRRRPRPAARRPSPTTTRSRSSRRSSRWARPSLERYDEVAEISLSCPNKHHFLVDLEPFGLDNPGEVFFAADRPYGLIQATVQREERSEA